ncbi:hypothetical protein EYF80_019868 [Liparis tanakae]|uniref:Uncharacterized protein n=1 Tax=Liparis tanakae TaxID=230148 RepID=A0A4Z2HXD2_9TELE|nr:hypothetical protein EYF80_019868 [Liparis tanakae]
MVVPGSHDAPGELWDTLQPPVTRSAAARASMHLYKECLKTFKSVKLKMLKAANGSREAGGYGGQQVASVQSVCAGFCAR